MVLSVAVTLIVAPTSPVPLAVTLAELAELMGLVVDVSTTAGATVSLVAVCVSVNVSFSESVVVAV